MEKIVGDKNKPICPYGKRQYGSPIIDDGIDLLDIWNALCERRVLILVVTALVTVAASAYAFLSPPIYETKVKITPSFDLGIGLLMAEDAPSAEKVFAIVQKNLQDRTVYAQFWAESGVVKRWAASSDNMSEAWFVQKLSIDFSRKKKGAHQVLISLSGHNPTVVAEVLNDFIFYVDDFSGKAVIDNLQLKLAEKKLATEVMIERLRRIEEKNIQSMIAKLNEQKVIAEKLKIVEIPGNLVDAPPFAQGVKALQVQIDVMRQRKNNDLFITGLPVLQEKIEAIGDIDFSNVRIFTMQSELALVPRQPKHPKQQLIIIVGVTLGLMVGIFTVLLLWVVGNGVKSKRKFKFTAE